MALLLAGHTGAFALYGPQHSEYTPVVGSVSAHEARAPSLGLGGDDLGAQQGELALLLDESLHQLDRELRLLRRVVLGAALLRRARGEGSAGGGGGATLEGPWCARISSRAARLESRRAPVGGRSPCARRRRRRRPPAALAPRRSSAAASPAPLRPEEAALRAARAAERVLLPRHLLHGAHPSAQALGLEVAPEDHARVLLLVELRRQNLLVLLVGPAERPIVDRERGAGHRWHEVHQILAQVLLGDGLGELRARVARRHQMRRRPPRQHRIGGRGQSNSRGAMLRFRPTVDTRRVYHEKLRRTAIRRPRTCRRSLNFHRFSTLRPIALTAAASRR